MSYVLDCSVAIAWVIPDETSAHTDALLAELAGGIAVVPQVWPLEVANMLLVAGRRGRITDAETERALKDLSSLPIEVDELTYENAFGATMSVARAHALSPYDAAYLELAMRRELPLATLDTQLRTACSAAGIETL